MFENKVFRAISGAKRDEIGGQWGKLLIAELHAFRVYSSPDIIRNLKSIQLRWEGHVARIQLSRAF